MDYDDGDDNDDVGDDDSADCISMQQLPSSTMANSPFTLGF